MSIVLFPANILRNMRPSLAVMGHKSGACVRCEEPLVALIYSDLSGLFNRITFLVTEILLTKAVPSAVCQSKKSFQSA